MRPIRFSLELKTSFPFHCGSLIAFFERIYRKMRLAELVFPFGAHDSPMCCGRDTFILALAEEQLNGYKSIACTGWRHLAHAI
jgi:hypothetical protein